MLGKLCAIRYRCMAGRRSGGSSLKRAIELGVTGSTLGRCGCSTEICKSTCKEGSGTTRSWYIFYTQYLQTVEAARKESKDTEAPEIIAQRDRAEAILQEGLKELSQDALDQRAVEANFALADILIRKGMLSEADQTLKREGTGALPVLAAGSIELRPAIRMETLRLALQLSVEQAISGNQSLDSNRCSQLLANAKGRCGES